MPEGIPLPGRKKPTERQMRRWQLGRGEDWLFPRRNYEKGLDRPGLLICARCHASADEKRWYYDEHRYEQLKLRSDARFVLCPGCQRIERQIYGGVVQLRSPLLLTLKNQALHLIYHTEEKARASNPIARLASVEERGRNIRVVTTTRFLAARIGKEFEKAFGGDLQIQNLPREKFARVYWSREA